MHYVFCILVFAFTLFIARPSLSDEGGWAATYGSSINDVANPTPKIMDVRYTEAGHGGSLGAGYWDIWVLKLKADGTVEWQKTYGGDDWEIAKSVQQTGDGGYIVAGQTESFGAGKSDFWVLKLQAYGTVEWQRTYGGDNYDAAYSIHQTDDGGYIVAGETRSFGTLGTDLWVLKLRPRGTVEWQKRYGGIKIDEAHSVQQTLDGGYIVAGGTSSFGAGWADLLVLKLKPDSDVEWKKTYGGSGFEEAHCIQQTSDGGYIVAGRTRPSKVESLDIWILKLKLDGSVEWQVTGGGIEDDAPSSLQQTQDSGYIVAGVTYFPGQVKPWVLKLRPDGTPEWQKTYLGSSGGVHSIQQTIDGGYVIVGVTYSFGGPCDVWVLKLRPDGTVEWQKAYGGDCDDGACSIHQTSDGGYVVAGWTGTPPDEMEDVMVPKRTDSSFICKTTDATVLDTRARVTDSNVSPRDTAATIQDIQLLR